MQTWEIPVHWWILGDWDVCESSSVDELEEKSFSVRTPPLPSACQSSWGPHPSYHRHVWRISIRDAATIPNLLIANTHLSTFPAFSLFLPCLCQPYCQKNKSRHISSAFWNIQYLQIRNLLHDLEVWPTEVQFWTRQPKLFDKHEYLEVIPRHSEGRFDFATDATDRPECCVEKRFPVLQSFSGVKGQG